MLATKNFGDWHTVVGEVFPGAEDNDGLSQQACTALSEEQSTSVAVTDHAHISESVVTCLAF